MHSGLRPATSPQPVHPPTCRRFEPSALREKHLFRSGEQDPVAGGRPLRVVPGTQGGSSPMAVRVRNEELLIDFIHQAVSLRRPRQALCGNRSSCEDEQGCRSCPARTFTARINQAERGAGLPAQVRFQAAPGRPGNRGGVIDALELHGFFSPVLRGRGYGQGVTLDCPGDLLLLGIQRRDPPLRFRRGTPRRSPARIPGSPPPRLRRSPL